MKKIRSSDDPIKELGTGINSFHQMILALFFLFLILALLHIPVLKIFYDYHYY